MRALEAWRVHYSKIALICNGIWAVDRRFCNGVLHGHKSH